MIAVVAVSGVAAILAPARQLRTLCRQRELANNTDLAEPSYAYRMLCLLTLGRQTINKVPGINAMLDLMFDEGKRRADVRVTHNGNIPRRCCALQIVVQLQMCLRTTT